MRNLMLSAALALLPVAGAVAATPVKATTTQPDLRNGMIKVAFAISPHVNVMDVAGPWEVFGDTSLKNAQGKEVAPYELYTVADSKAPLNSVGANRPGLTITPDYDFAHAPRPDIVVVPAQSGSPALKAWLKRLHAQHITVMSVCTGAFQLAEAGLLDGKAATTHHWYFGNFTRAFPKVKLVKQVRYVQSDPVTFTSGGLTSGVDLALHLVTERFGQDVAQQTADFMEYLGTGWKTNQGISALAMPITHEDWTGKLEGDAAVVLRITTYGASPAFALDIPSQKVKDAPATPSQDGAKVAFEIAIPGHPATIRGQLNAGRTVMTGTFTQDGRSQALTLTQRKESSEPARQ